MTASTFSMRERMRRAAAVVVAVLGVVLIGWALAADSVAGWPGGGWSISANALTAALWLAAGAVTAIARPSSLIGWLLLIGAWSLGLSGALSAQAAALAIGGDDPPAAWLGWVGGWIFFPQLGAAAVIYLLFPDGRLPSPRWRGWLVLAVAATVAATALVALAPGSLAASGPLAGIPSPVGFALPGFMLPVAIGGLNVAFAAGLAALLVRRRRADAGGRRILNLLIVLGVANLIVGVLAVAPAGDWVFAITVPITAGLTGTICAAIVWGDLWDIRRTAGRVLVALILTGLVVLAFVGIVAAVAAVTPERLVGVTAAALVVCLVFAPLQAWLRSRIERLLYGRRSQPYEVLADFGSALETAGAPEEALHRLAALAVTSLRLTGVAIEGEEQETGRIASAGTLAPERVVSFPIRHQGIAVGVLLVDPRVGETDFESGDRRLLEDLARQAGSAVHGVALNAALRRHRADLVVVRESERRRLRRDLHDGVASGLTAIGLTVEVAEDALADRPERTGPLLADARAGISTVLADLRRVVEGLGPSTLADLGLAAGLSTLARRFSTSGLTVVAQLDPDLPTLPPAVEEAVFWIAGEALQNVARHALATQCVLTVRHRDGRVVLTIDDDGRGLPESPSPGVGLESMRLRAEEVGGLFSVGRSLASGVAIIAELPVDAGVAVDAGVVEATG